MKELGDGLLLWFPDAPSAFDTTLRLQSRFEDASALGLPLWVRMGVHCGKALVKGADLIGHDVNVAAASSTSPAPERSSPQIKTAWMSKVGFRVSRSRRSAPSS